MIRVLFAILALSFAVLAAAPARAEMANGVVVVPMEKLPSYGSMVSAWYKQKIYDPNEKKVGVVSDMLFTPGRGVDAVMIDVGGFLGIGGKHVAVPTNAISVTAKNGKTWLTINTTKDVLKQANGYKLNRKTNAWEPM